MKDMVELARTAWTMVSLALVAVFVWALLVLPERVPQHVDTGGSVTEWGSKTTLLVGMAIAIATTLSLGPLARGISRAMSLDLVNVPHKDRWLPAHEGALRARVATDLYAVGASTGGLLAGIQARKPMPGCGPAGESPLERGRLRLTETVTVAPWPRRPRPPTSPSNNGSPWAARHASIALGRRWPPGEPRHIGLTRSTC